MLAGKLDETQQSEGISRTFGCERTALSRGIYVYLELYLRF